MTYKNVRFPDHAVNQMRRRGFSRGEVWRLLATGNQIVVQTTGGGERRLGKRGLLRGYVAEVIYLEDAYRIELVTVYWVAR